jgi:hypothetical protein
MIDLGAASEHDMVLAFLQAEISSPRWRQGYAQVLASVSADRALVEQPDLADAQQNALRSQVLQHVRGYRANSLLFTGFPVDSTIWRRVLMEPADLALVRYCNPRAAPNFIRASQGTRRVVEAARHLDSMPEPSRGNVRAVLAALAVGQTFPPLIAVQSGEGDFILVEGYTRATAYAAWDRLQAFPMYMGSSPDIRRWLFF